MESKTSFENFKQAKEKRPTVTANSNLLRKYNSPTLHPNTIVKKYTTIKVFCPINWTISQWGNTVKIENTYSFLLAVISKLEASSRFIWDSSRSFNLLASWIRKRAFVKRVRDYIPEALRAITLHCSFMATSWASFLSSRALSLTFSSMSFWTSTSFCIFSFSSWDVFATSLLVSSHNYTE